MMIIARCFVQLTTKVRAVVGKRAEARRLIFKEGLERDYADRLKL